MRAAAGCLSLVAALAACRYNPTLRPGVISCEPGGTPCPPPYVCVVNEGRGLCQEHEPALDGPENRPDLPPALKPDGPPAPPADTGTGGMGVLPDAGPDGSADVAAPADVPLPAPPPDAGPDASPDAHVCPLGRGPDMVYVGSAVPFCIDTTEVTNLQYKQFLDDSTIDKLVPPERCRGMNDGYAPTSSDGGGLNVTTRADHPVVNVDWCDAYAFCQWAGKRLCGTITGGPLAAGAAAVPSVSQWSHACTRGGVNSFPYGLTFNHDACHIGQKEFPIATLPVRMKRGCVGGFVGIFDMVGNVEEWVDFCREDPVEGWVCGVMGAPYTAKDAEAHCGEFYDDKMIDHWVARGFRCCAP